MIEEYFEEADFVSYFKALKENKKISTAKLAKGLCSERNIMYYVNKKRNINYGLRERLLSRLGVGAEDFQFYLGADEYDRWHARASIFYDIKKQDLAKLKEHISTYREKYSKNEAIEEQFLLDMTALGYVIEGRSNTEILNCLEQALRYTVDYNDDFNIFEHVLADVEINLILDVERYGQGRNGVFYDVVKYIEGKEIDKKGLAKIYPKAVYLYIHGMKRPTSKDVDYLSLLELCNKAIEVLRDSESLYYMWELLTQRDELYALCFDLGIQVDENLVSLNKSWIECLEYLYDKYDVEKTSFEHTNLYLKRGAECINDIIRVRRKMLGITVKELCTGICSERTLQRIESRETSPQGFVAIGLLRRLRVAESLRTCEIVIDNPKAKKSLEDYKKCINTGKYKEACSLLRLLKTLTSQEILQNKQFFMENEALLSFMLSEIEKDEYLDRLKEALELTVPYKWISSDDLTYFTKQEYNYIQNMIYGYDNDSKEKRKIISFLERKFSQYINTELQAAVAGHFEYIMASVQSYLGNVGEYERSSYYSEYSILELLRNRRTFTLTSCIYNRWWNDKEKGKVPVDISALLIYKTLAVIYKDSESEAFIDKKLNQFPFAPRFFSSSDSSLVE